MPHGHAHAHAHARPHVTYHARPVHVASHHIAPVARTSYVSRPMMVSRPAYIPPSHGHHGSPSHTNRAGHLAHRAGYKPWLYSNTSTSTTKTESKQTWNKVDTLATFSVVGVIVLFLAWWIVD